MDDYAITEGDIIIGKKQAVREWTHSVERGQLQVEASRKALAVDAPKNVWNLKGTDGVVRVPYTVSAGNRRNIDAAISEVNRVLAGVVRWVPRETEVDYVDFNLSNNDVEYCASEIGRIGGKQEIWGNPECGFGGLVHEAGHAMGLWHIQQDARASSFVDLRLSNMDAKYRSNNEPAFHTRTWGGYDYESNMHYSRTGFSASSADTVTLETKPPGISIGVSPSFSIADLDALFRLYDKAPTQTTLNTNPSGLRIVVDGVAHTTPVKFNWPIGSIHRVWVEPGLQSLEGFRYVFGRWSHDASADPSPQLTWDVRAGDGRLGSPTTAPSDTVIVANFVRLIEVQSTPNAQAGGISSVIARRSPWSGTTNLYPQFTTFDLTAQSAPSFVHFFRWDSAISSKGGSGITPTVSLLLKGDRATQTLGAAFFNGRNIAVDLKGDGLEDGVEVRYTSPDGTTAKSTAPFNLPNATGTWNINMQSPQFLDASIRYVRDAYEGFDNVTTGDVAMPATGTRTVTIRAHREVAPYKQARPSCAGSVVLSDSANWLRTGSAISVTAVPNGLGVFAGWSGTLTGLNTSANITVGSTVPEFVANFNQIVEPLTLSSVSPDAVGSDFATTTLEIRGTGFTPTSQVVTGIQTETSRTVTQVLNASFVNSTTLRVTVAREMLPTGRIPLFVVNALSPSCQASSNSVALDVLATGQMAYTVLTEFYNPAFDYYFLTGRESEKQLLSGLADWRRTGAEMKLYANAIDAALPLERFFFANVARGGLRGSHFFTSLAAEQRLLTSLNTTNLPERAKPYLESIEGYTIEKRADGSCPERSIPVYRAFKGAPRYVADGNHRFSTSLAQHRDMVDRLGWADEGIVFCALP
ncbi:MAG: M12 family metallopeptidase [Casimicrobium sp.]